MPLQNIPDMAHPPARKTIVKKISSLYILVSDKAMRVQEVKLKICLGHSLYHKSLKGKLRSSSFLTKILENPERILETKGSRKVNLILYLVFLKQADSADLRPLKRITCSKQQKTLYGLLSFGRKAWSKLLRKYPESFVQLHEYLQFEDAISRDSHLDGMSDTMEILRSGRALVHMLKHAQGERFKDGLPRIVALHRDFCEVQGPNYISKFGQDYVEMVEGVLRDRVSGKMVPGSSFFPEIRLYNDYLLARDDPDFFDQSLFRQRFTTLNERGIRDYVKRKLEEKTYE